MKTLIFTLGLLLTSYSMACDLKQVKEKAKSLELSLYELQERARVTEHYHKLAHTAAQLRHKARDLVTVQATPHICKTLRKVVHEEFKPILDELHKEFTFAQSKNPSPAVGAAFKKALHHYHDLGQSLAHQADRCEGLAGAYSGVCRIVNKPGPETGINFRVSSQGGQCVISDCGYFQNANLAVSNGQGHASVLQHPGGVAIANTQVFVYPKGNFKVTGYNYAGKFHFICQK